MKSKPGLTAAQARQFLEKGYVAVKNCFAREAVAPWIADAYERMGCDPRDPRTWKEEKIELKGTEGLLVSDFAPKAWEAICALVGGEERVSGGRRKQTWSNSFIVKFPSDPDGAEPRLIDRPWHKDGPDLQYLDSPEMGLLTYVVWSDLKPGGGGTLILPESIAPVCRHWAQHPEGADKQKMPLIPIVKGCTEVVQLTGEVGDVFLVHPAMIHSESTNRAASPRFFTVRYLELAEPLNFNREDKKDFSLVESVVLRSLGVERFEFKRK
jgi:hypothetical protein